MLSNNKATASRYFEYKTKIKGEAAANNHVLNTKAVLPLKYLSNFWKSLDQPFINCEIELHLTWSEDSIISEMLSKLKFLLFLLLICLLQVFQKDLQLM